MAGLEQFHQRKSHDETDSTPFEASQNGLEHPAQTLPQATTALKRALDLGATLNWRVHQLLAHFQNQSFEGPSTLYGVGAGEADSSEGEGEASVSAAFFLAAVLFFFAGDGDGDALAVAAVVDVAVVSCFCVQETMNTMPIRTVINVKRDFFTVTGKFERRRMFGRPLNNRQ
jgi:hypothetical protein